MRDFVNKVEGVRRDMQANPTEKKPRNRVNFKVLTPEDQGGQHLQKA